MQLFYYPLQAFSFSEKNNTSFLYLLLSVFGLFYPRELVRCQILLGLQCPQRVSSGAAPLVPCKIVKALKLLDLLRGCAAAPVRFEYGKTKNQSFFLSINLSIKKNSKKLYYYNIHR